MSVKKSPPRNSFVKAMTLRTKSQIFHHKTEERGGAHNDQPGFLEEVDPVDADGNPMCFSCDVAPQKYVTGLCQGCHDVAVAVDRKIEEENDSEDT